MGHDPMKTLLGTAAVAAALAFAAPVSAQMYAQPMGPAPMQQTMPYQATSGAPTWMMDDGSSSDYPIHNPGDISGQQLNSQYQGGLTVPPGEGFPWPYQMR